MTASAIRNSDTIAVFRAIYDVVRMLWKLRKRQGYGLTQFKRCAPTCIMSYTVADLGVVGCRQHYLSQTDSDKGLHWYFDIRAFCMGQPNQQLFHLGTHCRCEYDSAFGLWLMLRSETETGVSISSYATYTRWYKVAYCRVAGLHLPHQ